VAYIPKFMRELERFRSALKNIRTPSTWTEFEREWFDAGDWPNKTPSQLAEEALTKRGPLLLGGRVWSYTTFSYDITPESRYEYMSATRMIGGPLKFPNWNSSPKKAENGWRQECPYCEISTSTIGNPECPVCHRQLILEWYAE
jgi:hypothetical protein